MEYLELLLHVVGCAGAVRYCLQDFVLSVDYRILEWCLVLVRGFWRVEDGGGGVGFGGGSMVEEPMRRACCCGSGLEKGKEEL